MKEQNACVVGMQWGDEGKGKVIDLLSEQFDVVVRAQGGSNAGHTVVVGDRKFILHLVPSGVIRGASCVIGNGVVVDPDQLRDEIEELRERGVEVAGNLLVSDRAHVVCPYHKALDAAREQALGDRKIGTTLRGIGPTYADKVARTGLRVGQLIDQTAARAFLQTHLPLANKVLQHVYGAEPLDLDEMIDWALRSGSGIRTMVGDAVEFLNNAAHDGEAILFEGAQGTLLDIDFGTYPYATSSNSSVGGMVTGTGLPPVELGRVIGVLKAYTTRVGGGPFPTELDDELGGQLRERGGEYGATTQRPRRCGWFDAVAARYTAMLNGVDELAVTKLDVLRGMDPIRICVAYEVDGRRTESFPARADQLAAVRPVYEEMPGWQTVTAAGDTLDSLCPEAAAYVRKLSELADAPVKIVSVGSKRSETVFA
ncbi:MAG: adenylosuccinate synthase [Planctomycetota bacterium]